MVSCTGDRFERLNFSNGWKKTPPPLPIIGKLRKKPSNVWKMGLPKNNTLDTLAVLK